ncbi:phage tail tube protein [Acidimangrovimonas sediminis]|uniref:phage tail tube protein n=1 Tax=Acidimangrovimonas sediminis TaxID=2056283 RepID=UPI000C808A8E|nr:phage tail tube protein [Acidimangrovimonas sediminis]
MPFDAPLYWNTKIILAKIEASYGVDATPTGADNALLVKNVSLSPMEGADVSRDLEKPWLGADETIPNELHVKFTFDVELAPSGTAGIAPAWGPLLRGCGVAETITADTSVVYNPVGPAHESLTFYVWIANTQHKIVGTRGDATIKADAQGIPVISYAFQGLFVTPAEAARVVPDLSAWQKPLIATTANTPTFTIDGTDFILRSFSLKLGNQIENRFLINSESVLITDRSDAIESQIQAVPLTTLNPYALAAAQTKQALQLVHGKTAGAIATLDVPSAQIQRPAGLENQQNIAEWKLGHVPLPVAGNDQWTLTLT